MDLCKGSGYHFPAQYLVLSILNLTAVYKICYFAVVSKSILAEVNIRSVRLIANFFGHDGAELRTASTRSDLMHV